MVAPSDKQKTPHVNPLSPLPQGDFSPLSSGADMAPGGDNPTGEEESVLKEAKERVFKPLLDARAFFRLRSALLREPLLATKQGDSRLTSKPLAFALQGTVIPVF